MEPEKPYTLTQAAAQAACSPRHLRKLANQGLCPSFKVGRPWGFPRDEFDVWVRAQRCSNTDSINAKNVEAERQSHRLSGGLRLAERLKKARTQLTRCKRTNLRKRSPSVTGDDANSATILQFPSQKPQCGG